jgi:hypothetical protein
LIVNQPRLVILVSSAICSCLIFPEIKLIHSIVASY